MTTYKIQYRIPGTSWKDWGKLRIIEPHAEEKAGMYIEWLYYWKRRANMPYEFQYAPAQESRADEPTKYSKKELNDAYHKIEDGTKKTDKEPRMKELEL